MKFLALYLPQYHTFPENDRWWGKGYTEWSAVKAAKPLFKNHIEPKIPLNNNYYDLRCEGYKTWKWQAELANQYGVDGFCIYQYWFCGKQLMEKPAEILLNNKDINIQYCFCWANETWTKTWYGLQNEVLMEQTYGEHDDWVKHFEYMLPYFKDSRYIKIDNRPMLCIYRAQDIECMPQMLAVWNKLAMNYGFDGVYLVAGQTAKGVDQRTELYEAYYNFEPGLTLSNRWKGLSKRFFKLRNHAVRKINKVFHKEIIESIIDSNMLLPYINGAKAKEDLKRNTFLGAFPQWDNTPRRSYKGLTYTHTTPDFFRKQLNRIQEIDSRNNSYVFINAWNEWGEGCYLEPDIANKYAFLEVIKEFSETF
ncbi:glycoside hydrolase family 99-like domain-containing protein [Pygmaiobacter massiliensis]|uniref:glycosyltransferase WbsX family protein n=1 Tax=Pygmaiobacter massiliensis TaxID=1917873 RepID=UPI000C7E3568|nr:glycoside hydrolase family 99-like domain-containing protein [Pygmaiobacter massiliensis]